MDVFVVHEDWYNRENGGHTILGVFDTLEKATECFNEAKKQALNDELVFDTVDCDDEMNYCTYDDGYYDSAHYSLLIENFTLNERREQWGNA